MRIPHNQKNKMVPAYEERRPRLIPYSGNVKLAMRPKIMKPIGPGQKIDLTTCGMTSGPWR